MSKIEVEKMLGKRYGILTVIKFIGAVKKHGNIFLCICDCGKEIERSVSKLNRGDRSCGCLTGGLNDRRTITLTGKKFNALTVIEIAQKFEITGIVQKEVYWKCKCDCGKEIMARGCDLRSGRIKSCNCLRPELVAKNSRKYEPHISSARAIFSGKYSDGDLTFEQFFALTQMNCFYCGIEPNNKSNVFKPKSKERNKPSVKFSIENGDFIYNGLDRIDSTKNHTLENVVPCCRKCNTAKLNYSEKDFKEWITRLYHHYIIKRS